MFLPTGYYVIKKADTGCLIRGLDLENCPYLVLVHSLRWQLEHNKLIIRHHSEFFFQPPQSTVVEYVHVSNSDKGLKILVLPFQVERGYAYNWSPLSMCRVNIVLYVASLDSSASLNLKKCIRVAAMIFICLYANSFPKQMRGPA